MSTPPPYQIAYAVTYDSVTDSFVFTFVSGYTPQHIPRIGFTYIVNTGIPNGVTFCSEFTPTVPVNNGLTVDWTLATAPAGAISSLDLYNKILALYTGGPTSPVQSLAVTAPIVNTGTVQNQILAIQNSGVTAGSTILSDITVDAHGIVTAAASGTAANIATVLGYTPADAAATVTSITAGPGIAVTGTATVPIVTNTGVNSVTAGTNVTITGTATNPIISASGGGGGTTQSYAHAAGINTGSALATGGVQGSLNALNSHSTDWAINGTGDGLIYNGASPRVFAISYTADVYAVPSTSVYSLQARISIDAAKFYAVAKTLVPASGVFASVHSALATSYTSTINPGQVVGVWYDTLDTGVWFSSQRIQIASMT